MGNDPLEKIYEEIQEFKNDLYGNPQVRPPRQRMQDRLERVELYVQEEHELKDELRKELARICKEREGREERWGAIKGLLRWLGPAGPFALFTWLYSTFGGGTRSGP